MEKFVVRTKREVAQTQPSRDTSKCYKQTSMQSLKGVVVVEDILRCKASLKLRNQTKENIISALDDLSVKIPPRHVLKSTKIGHVINKLTKHRDDEVRTKASKLVKDWKLHFERKLDRPMIEVQCNAKTEKLRKAGRKLLASELRLNENHTLPEAIEREVFYQHEQLLSKMYRKRLRTLVFTLKHQEDIRKKVLNQKIDIKTFIAMYKDSAQT